MRQKEENDEIEKKKTIIWNVTCTCGWQMILWCISFEIVYDRTYAIFKNSSPPKILMTSKPMLHSIRFTNVNTTDYLEYSWIFDQTFVQWFKNRFFSLPFQNGVSESFTLLAICKRTIDHFFFSLCKQNVWRLGYEMHTCDKCGDEPRNGKCDMILSPAKRDRRSRCSVSIINSFSSRYL